MSVEIKLQGSLFIPEYPRKLVREAQRAAIAYGLRTMVFVTPKKTGYLASQWQAAGAFDQRIERLYNDVPYGIYVDQGTRYIEPRRFVEKGTRLIETYFLDQLEKKLERLNGK